MRIAMMTNNYKPFVGGVPISIELLAKGLIAAGHEVTVFAPAVPCVSVDFDSSSSIISGKILSTAGSADPNGPSNVCDGVPVFRYASLPYYFLGGAVCPNPLDPRIGEEFRRGHYDIIHVHHPMLIGRTAIHLSRRYGVPLVFTYHTRYEQYVSNAGVFRRAGHAAFANRFLHLTQEKIVPLYLSLFLQNCRQVFAPTDGMKEYLTETCGFDPARIAVLPTGIEDSCFHADEAAVKEAQKRLLGAEQCGAPHIPLFLSVSRLSNEKNIPFLLRSAARFKERYRKPFRLAIIGDGPDRAEYEALRRRLHLEQEVIFPGSIPHEELAPYYAAADAFLFASRTETQGIVILEAFAGGAPVIALDASGVRDLVRDRINGLLCAEDEDAFAKKINLFLTDPMLREQLRRRALATAVDFREESVVKKAIRFYNIAYQQNNRQEHSRAPVTPDQMPDTLRQTQILQGLRQAFFASHS